MYILYILLIQMRKINFKTNKSSNFNCTMYFLQYEKLVLTKDLKIEKVEIVTQGRKTTLVDIRKNMLNKNRASTSEKLVMQNTMIWVRTS